MSKFLLNLLLQISKALVNSKIQFLFGKEFFTFGPIGPAASWPARPLRPAGHRPFPFSPAGRTLVLGPSRPARQWRIGQNTSPFSCWRNPATTPSPSVTTKWAPPVSSIFHLTSADPGHAAASLGHLAPPHLYLEMPSQAINFPTLIPRVNPSLTTLPAFNDVNTINTAGYWPLPPLRCSPGPYINPQGPPATPTPPLLALKLSLALLRSRADLASLPRLHHRCAASSPSSELG
jgi:hypothetical protein